MLTHFPKTNIDDPWSRGFVFDLYPYNPYSQPISTTHLHSPHQRPTSKAYIHNPPLQPHVPIHNPSIFSTRARWVSCRKESLAITMTDAPMEQRCSGGTNDAPMGHWCSSGGVTINILNTYLWFFRSMSSILDKVMLIWTISEVRWMKSFKSTTYFNTHFSGHMYPENLVRWDPTNRRRCELCIWYNGHRNMNEPATCSVWNASRFSSGQSGGIAMSGG